MATATADTEEVVCMEVGMVGMAMQWVVVWDCTAVVGTVGTVGVGMGVDVSDFCLIFLDTNFFLLVADI